MSCDFEDVPFSVELLIEDSAITTIWAKIVPFQQNGKYLIFATCLEQIAKDDVSYYSFLYCGMFHYLFARKGALGLQDVPLSFLSVKQKTVERLRQHLGSLHGSQVSDQLLGVMISLA